MLNELLESLSNNPWVVLMGYVIGIIGFYLRIQSAIRLASKKKIPSYKIRSLNVITESHLIDDLLVTFKGNQIRNLTVTKIAIWNSGKETINFSDVPESDPIAIKSSKKDLGAVIYNAEILRVNEPSNQIALEKLPNGEGYKIKFDYLDFRQGVLLKLIHSGVSIDDIEVTGRVKGFGKIVNKGSYIFENLSLGLLRGFNKPNDKNAIPNKRNAITAYLIMIVMCVAMMALFRFKSNPFNVIFSIVAALIATQILVLIFYNPIPDGFEVLEDDELESKPKQRPINNT